MFVRRKQNRSGSLSLRVIQKYHGFYKVYKTIGCATAQQDIEKLERLTQREIEKLTAQAKLFASENNLAVVEQAISAISNADIRTVDPEMVFGKIYQITYSLPDSKHSKTRLLNMDENQTELTRIINANF